MEIAVALNIAFFDKLINVGTKSPNMDAIGTVLLEIDKAILKKPFKECCQR